MEEQPVPQQHGDQAEARDNDGAQQQQPVEQHQQEQWPGETPQQHDKLPLLQLPDRALRTIASCLTTRDALGLACRVMPKNTPAAAAVFSGITKADMSCHGTTQPVLARLQQLEKLRLRFWLQKDAAPQLSSLASLAHLSNLDLIVISEQLPIHDGWNQGIPPGQGGLACCHEGTCLPELKEQRQAELLQQLGHWQQGHTAAHSRALPLKQQVVASQRQLRHLRRCHS